MDPYAIWSDQPIVLIDFETTGFGDDDRIVEIGVARFENGKEVDSWGSLLYPEIPIPAEATLVHGITDTEAAVAPRLPVALPNVIRLCRGAHPAAYNQDFDRRFWFRELERYSMLGSRIPLFDPAVRWIDPLIWARLIDNVLGRNKLADVAKRHAIEPVQAHRATDDASTAGKVLFKLAGDIGRCTVTELLRQQGVYADRQEKGYQLWKARKDAAANGG